MTAKFGAGAFGQTLYSAGSPIEISGTMAVRVGFQAALNNSLAVSGAMPVAVEFKSDRLNGDFLLKGELDLAIGLIPATLFAGPLWGPDTLCAGQWEPDTLCADPGWTADPDIQTSSPWAPSVLCDG